MTNLKYSGWIFQALLIMMQVPQSTATQKWSTLLSFKASEFKESEWESEGLLDPKPNYADGEFPRISHKPH